MIMNEPAARAIETMFHGHIPGWTRALRQSLLDAGWVKSVGEGYMHHYRVTQTGIDALAKFRGPNHGAVAPKWGIVVEWSDRGLACLGWMQCTDEPTLDDPKVFDTEADAAHFITALPSSPFDRILAPQQFAPE